MTPEALIGEVLRVAGELGLTSWERIIAILAVALLLVLGRRGIAVLRALKGEPQIVADENGPQIDTPAEPTTGEPGGGPTGGMG